MKKLFIFVLFIFTLFNLTPFKTFADTTSTTYYVDLINGSDINVGTSVDKALKSIEKAYQKVRDSGDTICIIGGYTFQATTNLPPKAVKITSLTSYSQGRIYFRYDVSINADTVFENVDLAFMNPDDGYGERAIYANGHSLTIGPGVDTNYQPNIKYACVYGGSFSEPISASPNITLISGQFDTIYAGGYNNYTVTDATINLKSNGLLQIANVDTTSALNPDNVVINYINSGSRVSNKINASGGKVKFTDANTDLNYPIENASQVSMSNSILNIYENGNFKSSPQKKLNFILDNNSKLKIKKNDPLGDYIFNIDGDFEGYGTIDFLPNSYLNINGNVSGSTEITQLFPASRMLISATSGVENNFYPNNPDYQIKFEQNSDLAKWGITIPLEGLKTYYVNGSAENHGDGSSVENPLKTIEEAITSSENGDYIYICGDTNVLNNLDMNESKYITISGAENAKLNFVSENPLINITYGCITFESNVNITGSVPNIYMENGTAILDGGKFNKIYAQDDDTSELEVKGSLINTIKNIDSVKTIGYGENSNFAALPNLINVGHLTISSSYIEFNGSLVDIQTLTVENSTINIVENTSISGTTNLGDMSYNLPVKLNIASGKKLEFKDSIYILSDIYIDIIGDPDENTYLICSSNNVLSGGIKSAHPENYEFEEIKDESFTSYKLKRKPEYIVPVSSVKLDKFNINLEEGETEKINTTILPEYAADKSIYWISSDSNIATVDSDGNIVAISKGTANITAITNDGNKTSTCVVNVSEKIIQVTSIELDKTNLSLQIGDNYKITASVLPENTTVKTLNWVSSNPEVASVDENGNVIAISKGTTTITVSSDNISTNCTVNVTEKVIPITSIELDKTNLSLQIGDNYKITASVLPENTTVKTLNWSSSNPEVASVDENGNAIAISKGTTTITVSSNNVSTNCIVNVTEKVIPITSIELDKTNLSLHIGDSYKIITTILPENASVKTLNWSSSNPEVASVDENGNVIAISNGVTTITVSSYDGIIKSYCNINVYTLSDAEIELSKAIEEANEVLKAPNPSIQSLLKEVVKLSKAIKNLNNEQ